MQRHDLWKLCLIFAMPAVALGCIGMLVGMMEAFQNALPQGRLLGATIAVAGAVVFGAALISCSLVASGSTRGFGDREA